MDSRLNRVRDLHSRSNTPSPIHMPVNNDAIPRAGPVPEIDGRPTDGANQLLPNTDPRVPTVGQHPIRDYPVYKPPDEALALLGNWEPTRGPQRATALRAEFASESSAATMSLRSAQQEVGEGSRVHTESTRALGEGPDSWVREDSTTSTGTSTAYRLRPVAPVLESKRVGPQSATELNAATPQQESESAARAAQGQRAAASIAALWERSAVPEAMHTNVSVDRAPAEFVARGHSHPRADSLTEPMQRLSLAASTSAADRSPPHMNTSSERVAAPSEHKSTASPKTNTETDVKRASG